MKDKNYVLVETASGYGLFSFLSTSPLEQLPTNITEFKEATGTTLEGFKPFTSAEEALENAQAILENKATKFLEQFLISTLPELSKKSKVKLGVQTPNLGNSISKIPDLKYLKLETGESVNEILRSIRSFQSNLIPQVKPEVASQARLGLGHSFSRKKISFNVNKQDNMVIQASALLQQLDKDVNTNAMRAKEWYAHTFPELVRLVPDPIVFSRLAEIHVKKKINEENESKVVKEIEEILQDEELAKTVYVAGKASMGLDISDGDFEAIKVFAAETVSLAKYRQDLLVYLTEKLDLVAPNLTAILGEQLTGRLITHAGGLTSLAKCPASTVQILGAEKALFRALKSRGKVKTPKYGLLFNSGFIAKANKDARGKMSRYLANKCVLAARIDAFNDDEGLGKVFGERLRQQIEDRLRYLNSGEKDESGKKNVEIMEEVERSIQRKRPVENMEVVEEMAGEVDTEEDTPKKKKSKKEKKEKKSKKKKKKKDK
eukprot:snap_masked-scaffold_91-processed-gene-0.33-mRNA-1 protein AED:0.10 eAED:0.10 QI:0/-1/0/1/-1/1/1/0/488